MDSICVKEWASTMYIHVYYQKGTVVKTRRQTSYVASAQYFQGDSQSIVNVQLTWTRSYKSMKMGDGQSQPRLLKKFGRNDLKYIRDSNWYLAPTPSHANPLIVFTMPTCTASSERASHDTQHNHRQP